MIKMYIKLLITVIVTISITANTVSILAGEGTNLENLDAGLALISGTDAFGRSIGPVSDFISNKYVGIFYFAWHDGQYHNSGGVQRDIFDITKLLREDREFLFDTKTNVRKMFYFNEPLYGYYNSSDPWVIRKHIELFVYSGIDFIAYDFTNYHIYWSPLRTMLELLLEYKEAGWDVPKVMFFTKKDCANQIPLLYEELYQDAKYDELWFRAGGEKPYLIAVKEDMPKEYWNYFELRHPFWPRDDFRSDGWPYVDFERPLRLFGNLMNVSVAQHTGSNFSLSVQPNDGKTLRPSWGRGYTTNNPDNGNVEAIERGDNFNEQWDFAIKGNPEIIFVTGWNEWIAPKIVLEGDLFARFVDSFNTEFSRDIEMTKYPNYIVDDEGKYIQEGYGDNFYMSLVRRIREYKGIGIDKNRKIDERTIDITLGKEQWEGAPVYRNVATQKTERDYKGFSNQVTYTQAAPDNFVKEIHVAHDSENLYFLIETDEDITQYKTGKTNWMNLFIGVEGSSEKSWERFQFVVNRNPVSETKTSLEVSNGGYDFGKKADVDYSVSKNTMQIKVPLKDLGIEKGSFTIYFKVADSIEKESDIMDYYVSGCSVPLGRLAYSYTSSYSTTKSTAKVNYTLPIVLALCGLVILGCGLMLVKTFKKK